MHLKECILAINKLDFNKDDTYAVRGEKGQRERDIHRESVRERKKV